MTLCNTCSTAIGYCICDECDKPTCGKCIRALNLLHVCRNCYYFMQDICFICEMTLEREYKNHLDCEKCQETVCINCAAVTGCQTTWGICKDCFDYKCLKCAADIPVITGCYSLDLNPQPYCEHCKSCKKSNNQNE